MGLKNIDNNLKIRIFDFDKKEKYFYQNEYNSSTFLQNVVVIKNIKHYSLIFLVKEEPYRLELHDIYFHKNSPTYVVGYEYIHFEKKEKLNKIYKNSIYFKKTSLNKRKNNLYTKSKLFKGMMNLKYGNEFLFIQ